MHVLHGLFYNFLRAVVAVKIADGVVVYRVAEKTLFYPAGADRHDTDIALGKLNAAAPLKKLRTYAFDAP